LGSDLDAVYRYHDGSKHHFHQFARSPGRLDWASQPRPFRAFHDTSALPLFPAPGGPRVPELPHVSVSYDQLFRSDAAAAPASFSSEAVGDLLRHALGLSAWKQFREARWSLRVNPSSGNLHPTEAYVVTGRLEGLSEAPSVFHYAADRHALERRCEFDAAAWRTMSYAAGIGGGNVCLVALTSIHWRESWKYGERAFRYCQHDLGHAIAAIRIAAALMGWRAVLLPEWPHTDIATLTGIDRDEDYVEAEREEPGCLLAITATGEVPDGLRTGRAPIVEAVRHGHWSGRASQLSEDHVQWTFIDEVARATEDRGRPRPAFSACPAPPVLMQFSAADARALVLQRRSAVAFDGRSSIGVDRFLQMLTRVLPGPHAPWDALWWTPRIHFVVFVHRVDGLDPGLYFLPRDLAVLDRIRGASRPEFLWEHVPPLFCLVRGDCRAVAARVSCGQDIASDGFFSLGMLAELDRSLQEFGPAFYRHLFWESGVVGQMLYLDAEAAGARATGIGCFFDDPVHDVLGLSGHAFQSLYHFTVGMPVEDGRLTTAPGYEWEQTSG